MGWINFSESASTLKYYVSDSSGNDSNDGLSPATPKKSVASGAALLRNGFPDWLLLARDSVFTGQRIGSLGKSGASILLSSGSSGILDRGLTQTGMMLIGSYGTGARPILLNTGSYTNAVFTQATHRYIAIDGLAFKYTGTGNVDGGISWAARGTGFIFQDMLISGLENVVQAFGGICKHVCFNRNIFLDSFKTAGHTYGLYSDGIPDLQVLENTFDHNGWHITGQAGAGPSALSHNLYLSNNDNLIVSGNISTRASSLGQKSQPYNGTFKCYDNSFILNSFTAGFGGGIPQDLPTGYQSGIILDATGNVGVNSIDKSSSQGLGFAFGNIASGRFVNNYLVNNLSPGGLVSILFADGAPAWEPKGVGFNNFNFSDNVVYNWGDAYSFRLENQTVTGAGGILPRTTGVVVSGNIFYETGTPSLEVIYTPTAQPAKIRFTNNHYQRPNIATTNLFDISGTTYNFTGWQAQSSDNSTTGTLSFADPTRGFNSYAVSLGLGDSGVLMNQWRNRGARVWTNDYTSHQFNDYIRAGFELNGETGGGSGGPVALTGYSNTVTYGVGTLTVQQQGGDMPFDINNYTGSLLVDWTANQTGNAIVATSSGTLGNGTLTANTTSVAGPGGSYSQALQFTGVGNDQRATWNNFALNGGTQFSQWLIFKGTGHGSFGTLVTYQNNAGDTMTNMFLDDTLGTPGDTIRTTCGTGVGNETVNTSPPSTVLNNTFHDILYTFSGGRGNIYLDGSGVGTGFQYPTVTQFGTGASHDLLVGGAFFPFNVPNLVVGGFKLWSVALPTGAAEYLHGLTQGEGSGESGTTINLTGLSNTSSYAFGSLNNNYIATLAGNSNTVTYAVGTLDLQLPAQIALTGFSNTTSYSVGTLGVQPPSTITLSGISYTSSYGFGALTVSGSGTVNSSTDIFSLFYANGDLQNSSGNTSGMQTFGNITINYGNPQTYGFSNVQINIVDNNAKYSNRFKNDIRLDLTQPVYVNDVGLELNFYILDAQLNPLDISSASVKNILLRNPNGDLVTKTASFGTNGTDGHIKYLTQAGDLDRRGYWTVQAFVTMGDDFYSDKYKLKVR